jgi:hypothetical protein
VLQLDTVENGVAHADVREVHAEELAVDTLASSALALFRALLLNGSPHVLPRDCGGASHVRIPPAPLNCFFLRDRQQK